MVSAISGITDGYSFSIVGELEQFNLTQWETRTDTPQAARLHTHTYFNSVVDLLDPPILQSSQEVFLLQLQLLVLSPQSVQLLLGGTHWSSWSSPGGLLHGYEKSNQSNVENISALHKFNLDYKIVVGK